MFNRRFFLQAGSLAALGRLSWSGVWNTPVHRQYEDELAQWWNEQGNRDIVYEETIQAKLQKLYGDLTNLRAFWSLFTTDSGSVYDNSGNAQTLTINDPSVTISSTNGVPYAQLPAPSIANLSRSHDPILQLADEATIGCWVRIANTTTSGPVIHKGAAGASTFLDFSYSLASDADNGYYCTFKQANNTTVSLAIEAGVDLDFDPLDWHFVVARFKRGDIADLTVNAFTKTTAVANSPLAATSQPLVIAQDIDNGSDPAQIDIALPFICAAYIPDSILNLVYAVTKPYFL